MGESESRPIIFKTPGFIIPQKKSRPLSTFPSPVLCNHVFLLFQAWEARALTEEDRGPQQVEIFLPFFLLLSFFNVMLGIEAEEVEEEEEGSELFLNNKPSDLLMLRCFLPQRVTKLMTSSPSRAPAC